jgi:hypothetical protein
MNPTDLLGIGVVVVIIVLFIQSFSWHPDKKQDPDAALGRAARSFFGKLFQ